VFLVLVFAFSVLLASGEIKMLLIYRMWFRTAHRFFNKSCQSPVDVCFQTRVTRSHKSRSFNGAWS